MIEQHMEAVGTLLAFTMLTFAIILLKSYHDGHIRSWLDSREDEEQQGREAHRMVVEEIGEDLQEIKSDVKETKKTTKSLAEQQQQIGEVVVMLHADDENVREDRLREQMEVDDLPSDILRDGGDDYRSDDKRTWGPEAAGPGADG